MASLNRHVASHASTVAERALVRRDVAWCICLLAALLLWDLAAQDLAMMRNWGGAAGFALRVDWVTTVLLHQGGRALGWIVMALLVLQLWWPLPFWPVLPRRDRVWWLATCVLCLSLIPVLKHISLTSCPWSLSEFGGAALYVSHWRWGIADNGSGGCFPSGHASAAFSFLAGYFALRQAHPLAARLWLASVVALGVLFGVGQTLRGAHYPSHTLWTAWICLAVTTASRQAWLAWQSRTDPNAP